MQTSHANERVLRTAQKTGRTLGPFWNKPIQYPPMQNVCSGFSLKYLEEIPLKSTLYLMIK